MIWEPEPWIKAVQPVGGEGPALPQIQILTRFRWRWRQFDVSEGVGTLVLPRPLALMSMMSLYKTEAGFGPRCRAYSLRGDACRNLPWCLEKKQPASPRGVAVVRLTAVVWYLSWVYGTRFLSLLALRAADVSSSCQLYYLSNFLMTCPLHPKSAPSWRGSRTQNFSSVCRKKLAQIEFETCLSHVSRNW